ncbi:TPA: ROK family glucokinase, partial [Streptococcus agalactiae]
DIVESLKHRLSLYGLTKDDFLGIGMGSPGAVDRTSKTVTGAFNLNWADTQEVGSVIEKEVGIPFFIDNDANVAALGERWVGAGANNPDVVFVTLGTGVGGGVIADGNLIHGVAGAGGEIGHMIVDPENGFMCTCGNKGCLETVASATGVVRVARQLAEQYEGSSAIKAAIDNGDTVTSKDIFIAAEDGDKFANSVVERVSRYLGLAAANISNILNPDSVVIGGGVSAAGEFLRSRVEKYFVTFAFPQVKKSTKIKIAELGNDAGIIGAASLANQQAS